jgi:hypothetical protein
MIKIAFGVIFTMPPSPKWPPTKSRNCYWSPISRKIDILGVIWSEELIGNNESCIRSHFYDATIFKIAANIIVKFSMVSDFNENWYLGVFLSEELVGALNSDMGVIWGLLCLHPNTIQSSYYYYNNSSSSRSDFVRPNSKRMIIRSLIDFTGRWIPSQEVHSSLGILKMAAVAMETVNVCQNLWPHLYWKLQRDFDKTWHIY